MIAPVAVGIVGIAIEFCMRRTYGKDPLYGLLLTFGAAMVIEETSGWSGAPATMCCRCRRPSAAASCSAT